MGTNDADVANSYSTKEEATNFGVNGSHFGGLKMLFRRQSRNARMAIFDGGDGKNTEAAFM